MGRARTDRKIQHVVRLSEAEEKILSLKAQEAGLSEAAFLRASGLGKPFRRNGKLDRDVQKEIWKQIAGAGRNLNQMTKIANMERGIRPAEVESLAAEIRRLTTVFLEATKG